MKWICDACSEVHSANPSECKNCDSTILTQYRERPATESQAGTVSSTPPPPADIEYSDRVEKVAYWTERLVYLFAATAFVGLVAVLLYWQLV